jgi:multimeric flavodoxin WrbA
MAADILVLAGPIWLGDNSLVTKQVIERLYSCSSLLTPKAGTRITDGPAGA